jgi:hypothetical protein
MHFANLFEGFMQSTPSFSMFAKRRSERVPEPFQNISFVILMGNVHLMKRKE